MATVKESAVIHASVDTVWSLLTTPNQILEWYEGLDSLDPSPNYPEVGSSFAWTYKVSGISLHGTYKVLAITPHQSIKYQIDGLVTGTQDWQLQKSNGAVSLKVDTDYEVKGGIAGKIAEPVIHQINASNGKKSMEKLKALAET